eukprot:scaffold140176_cov81-Cyclotella_meneghiniana.AAC.1
MERTDGRTLEAWPGIDRCGVSDGGGHPSLAPSRGTPQKFRHSQRQRSRQLKGEKIGGEQKPRKRP